MPDNEPSDNRCRYCGARLGEIHSHTCVHWPRQRVKLAQTKPVGNA
jgi:hypothetical protein